MGPLRSSLVPAVLAAFLLCLAPSTAVAQKRNVGGQADFFLREKLVGRISRDLEMASERLNLVLANGGVFLSGSISNCNLQLRVFSTAASTFGVINVTDLTVVKRHFLSDDALRAALLDVLGARVEEFGLEGIEVTVENSVATIEGTSPNFYTRIKAEEAAGTVFGVTEIVNRVQPRDAPSGTDDASIGEAVVSYLRDPANYGFSADVEVSVEDGVVTLAGAGRLFMAVHQATLVARLVGGVKRVDVEMRVDPAFGMLAPQITRASP